MTAARHVMRVTRYPAQEVVVTVDGAPARYVTGKFTPDVITVVYETDDGEGAEPEPYVCGPDCHRLVTFEHTPDNCWSPRPPATRST
jgi:hypothetical protein